jgi:hypothetical protein
MPTTITARIGRATKFDFNKSGDLGLPYRPVECGRTINGRYSCGGILARVFVMPYRGRREPLVLSLSGWHPDEHGILRPSPREREKRRKDRRSASGIRDASGHDLLPPGVQAGARERLRTGAPHLRTFALESSTSMAFQDVRVVALPAEVQCERCHGINRLDPGFLVAVASWDPPRLTRRSA